MGVTRILFVFGVALGVAILLTPALRAVAARLGWTDRPAGRKSHHRAMPMLGGVAIHVAVLGALAAFPDRYAARELAAIVIGASFVSLVGLWDDRRPLGPTAKLVAQTAAAALLVASGVQVALPLPEWIDIALSLFWVIGVTNAFNLLDNVDGLAGGAASIASLCFLWLAVSNGQFLVGALTAALLGACLGFLLYNFNPASIFMGDTGSLFLGFVLAAVGIKLRFPDNAATVTWMVPILVLGVPLADTAFVVVTRSLRGLNPLTSPGRDHLSHRLITLGLSPRGAVLALYFAGSVTGLAGIWVSGADAPIAHAVALSIALLGVGSGVWLARAAPIADQRGANP